MTGAKASTPSTLFGRSWTWRCSIPRSRVLAQFRRDRLRAATDLAVVRARAVRSRQGPDQHLDRLRERRRITTDVVARRLDRFEQGRDLLDPSQPAVPMVGELGGEAQHPRAGRPDHDRQAVRSWTARLEPRRSGLDGLAGERRSPGPQHVGDDPQRLLEPPESIVERQPIARELRLVPPGAEAEDEPPATHLVERLGHLREQRRVPERHRQHVRRERHASRDRRQRGEQRPRVPGAPPSPCRIAEPDMVRDPQPVEPDGLGRLGHRQDVASSAASRPPSIPRRRAGSARARAAGSAPVIYGKRRPAVAASPAARRGTSSRRLRGPANR